MKKIQVQQHKIVIHENQEVFSPSITTGLLLDCLSVFPGESVCDMGAGTGVLGIMSSKLGAKSVSFIDIDLVALQMVKKNLLANQIENYELIQSDIFKNVPGKYDVIVVNLPQLPIAPKYETSIKPKDKGGGEKGNTLVLKFLNEAKDHLNKNGRIYFPIFGVSAKQTTIRTINCLYNSRTLKTQKVRVSSDQVIQLNLEHIYQLQKSGDAEIFKDEKSEYLEVSILELKKTI